MRRALASTLWFVLVASGCRTSLVEPGKAVVDVTVVADGSLSSTSVSSIRVLDVSVSGAETYHTTYPLGTQLTSDGARFVYRAAKTSGSLTFAIAGLDGSGSVVASGQAPASLADGQEAMATVTLRAGGLPPDMAMGGVDLGGADLGGADLGGVDLGGPTDGGVPDMVAGNPDLIGVQPPGDFRLLAPLSTSNASSRTPTLHWTASSGATGYAVDLCKDALCGTVLVSLSATGTSIAPSSALPPGPIFWRITAKNGVGNNQVGPWVLFIPNRSAPKDTAQLATPEFNRDGKPDLAIGSASTASEIYVNNGSGLPSTPTMKVTGGRSMAYGVDVNGDGYGDLVVGEFSTGKVYVYHGNVNGVGQAPAATIVGPGNTGFGFAVAGVGDVNGDGYGDVVAGEDDIHAAAMLYLGGPTGVSGTPSGGALPGSPVGAAGDVNGDGFADVIVCSRLANQAYTYLGGANGLVASTVLNPPNGESSFGEGCYGVGDVNGDGYGDVAVVFNGTAGAYVFYGSPTGVLQTGPSLLTGASGGGFGVISSVASAGDVNGDGFADVVLGAYNGDLVRVFKGGAGGVNTSSPTTITYSAGGYATAVATVGDVNGDGFADVVVTPSQCSGYAVHVLPGTTSGVSTTPLANYTAPNGEQCFGSSLAR